MYEKSLTIDQSLLPQPSGYKVLIAMPKVQQKTAGGIYMPDSLSSQEQTASIVGLVVKMGEDAYADHDKYPTGAWCKEGDWVMFRSYSGTRFKQGDQEFRLINDDTVEAVVLNPELYKRV